MADVGMAAKGEAHGASEPQRAWVVCCRKVRRRRPASLVMASEDSALKLISPKHVRNAFHRVLAKPRLALPPALLFASCLDLVQKGDLNVASCSGSCSLDSSVTRGADWSRFMQQVGTVVPVLADSKARHSHPAQTLLALFYLLDSAVEELGYHAIIGGYVP